MPTFKVIGRTPKAQRRRERTYQAIDEAAARKFAENDKTLVDSIELLPGPPADPALLDLAESLGVSLNANVGHLEAVSLVLMECASRCLKLEADYQGLHRTIEPYRLVRSPEGFRLRCWVDEPPDLPDVVGEDELGGWRQWLLDDIANVRPTAQTFQPNTSRDRQCGEVLEILIEVEHSEPA